MQPQWSIKTQQRITDMRAIVQRVLWAEVEVADTIVGQIQQGLLVYVGIAIGDTADDAIALADKIVNLRIFDDQNGKLNLSVRDTRGGVLAISNFTLLADARKGRRPAFTGAASYEVAKSLHGLFVSALEQTGVQIAKGVFGAEMIIRSSAIGPINLILDMPPLADAPVRGKDSNTQIFA